MRKFFSNFSLYWSIIVGVLLGGIWLVWSISGSISSDASLLLIDDSKGLEIEGPKSINRLLVFTVLLLILLLFVGLIAAIKESTKAAPEKRTLLEKTNELLQLRAQYDDVLRFSKNVVRTLYDEADDLKRVDPKKIKIRMNIDPDGSASVLRRYEIYCPAKPAHMLNIWIEADDECPGFLGHRKLRLRAKDVTNGQSREMDWIPVHDTLRRKELVLFFPEMQPGENKTIELEYFWSGYLKKLLDKGTVEFWWGHRAASEDATADVTYEWLFSTGFPQVRAKHQGNISPTAQPLSLEYRDGCVVWTYRDPSERIPAKEYHVLFELLSVEE